MPIPDLFLKKALEVVPRVLGLCDRDPASPTFGSCDRNYWHYRLTDVSNARFQEAGLLLALAYAVPSPENPFYKKENLRQWIGGIWNFWLKQRNSDGSSKEIYPFERSFCATSFTTAAFVQTVLLTGGAGRWEKELELARKTVDWLTENKQTDTANQMAASLVALQGYAVLTGSAERAKAARVRRDEVLALADRAGLFNEYGGPDTGYQSITMSLLARTSAITGGDDGILEVLRKGEKALAGRIGPLGEVDSRLNSRNTQFVYPYALAVLDSGILERLEKGLEQNRLLSPVWMDDRYCIPFAADYAMASGGFWKCG